MLDNKKKTFLAVETTTNNIGWNVVTEDYIKSGEYIAVAEVPYSWSCNTHEENTKLLKDIAPEIIKISGDYNEENIKNYRRCMGKIITAEEFRKNDAAIVAKYKKKMMKAIKKYVANKKPSRINLYISKL